MSDAADYLRHIRSRRKQRIFFFSKKVAGGSEKGTDGFNSSCTTRGEEPEHSFSSETPGQRENICVISQTPSGFSET